MPAPFTHRFRVRYAEVDPQSVVFNSRYLEYADLMITEYWRSIDLHFSGEDALEFHVVKATVEFVQPIRADEEIDGTAVTSRIGTSSVTTEIELYGLNDKERGEDDLRAKIELVHVHVDLDSGKPTPIPEGARAKLAGDTD
ncbi:MAG: thioesterase family protein [Pseudomonadota bacterium]